jgi:hypothetical protein
VTIRFASSFPFLDAILRRPFSKGGTGPSLLLPEDHAGKEPREEGEVMGEKSSRLTSLISGQTTAGGSIFSADSASAGVPKYPGHYLKETCGLRRSRK